MTRVSRYSRHIGSPVAPHLSAVTFLQRADLSAANLLCETVLHCCCSDHSTLYCSCHELQLSIDWNHIHGCRCPLYQPLPKHTHGMTGFHSALAQSLSEGLPEGAACGRSRVPAPGKVLLLPRQGVLAVSSDPGNGHNTPQHSTARRSSPPTFESPDPVLASEHGVHQTTLHCASLQQ